jgi:hypothetical protein
MIYIVKNYNKEWPGEGVSFKNALALGYSLYLRGGSAYADIP